MEPSQRPAKRRRVSGQDTADGGPVYKTLRSGRQIGAKHKSMPPPPPSGPAFHRFGRLPVEIRIYIWQLAAEAAMEQYHPLRVRMYKGFEVVTRGVSYDERKRKSVIRLAGMPDLASVTKARRSLLRASREAHNEVRRLWNHALPLNKGYVLYFSHSHDIVFLDIREQTIIPDLFRLKRLGELPSFTAHIGHVAFDMVPNFPLWMPGQEDMHPSIKLLFCFPRLHSVSLIHYNSFSPEIKWQLKTDVQWLLKRSARRGISFRSFKALDGFDYDLKCSVGNRQSARTIRHECAICTIHKCAYMISLLRNRPHPLDPRPQVLRPEQVAFLGKLRRFMLLAATPEMAGCIPAYDHHSAGWYNQRSALQDEPLGESVFAAESEAQHVEHVPHVHDIDSSDDDDEPGIDAMDVMGDDSDGEEHENQPNSDALLLDSGSDDDSEDF